MQSLEAVVNAFVRLGSQLEVSWWLPTVIAAIVFFAASWSIGKSVRAVLR